MAIMIPTDWVNSSASTQKLYSALNEQLSDDYCVIQYFDSVKAFHGSLFWIQNKQQSLFVYLGTSTKPQLESSSLETLLNNKEVDQLLDFQKFLLPSQLNFHKAQLAPLLVILPEIKELKKNISIKSLGLHILSKAVLENKNLCKLINQLIGQSNSAITQNHIRHTFSPEIRISQKVPSSLALLTDNLLNSEQELAAKADIALPKAKRRGNTYNLTGINGDASSGKTETLIQRAMLIRQVHPNKRMLLLSINKASTNALDKRYSEFTPKGNDTTEIHSLYQWCSQQLRLSKKLVCIDDIQDFINTILSSKLEEEKISVSTFLHELDFIHSRAIFYEKDYLEAQNLSRPYHLNEDQQSQVWKAYLLLKSELAARNWELWSRLPQLLWDHLNSNLQISSGQKLNHISYDHILVDDAHHFPPIAFEIFKQVLKLNSGQLFITQDLNQGINNPFSLWKDAKLDLKGHSYRLYNNYQTNPKVINAANAFYLNRLPNESNKHIIDSVNDDELNNKYTTPKLLHFHSMKDQVNRLLNEIKKTIQAGNPLQDILVLTPNSKTTAKIADIIKNSLEKNIQILNRETTFQHQQNSMNICNIIHSKGVSSPYVFIIDLQEIFIPEEQLNTSSPEYQNLIVENTRLLNMAMSRARKSLTLFMTADTIYDSLITPHIAIPTANTDNSAEITYIRKTD